uniref:Uncharacterized protein n=1 Tax=Oryza sativa subsp. japonica TaxID=39947 RepID=Q6ZBG5_ORYSJ|nr:hypothetical protein [Oryza sativa Japonica Group]BAD09743.1 hypothetical protein [Oryza sativa Japonica Group]
MAFCVAAPGAHRSRAEQEGLPRDSHPLPPTAGLLPLPLPPTAGRLPLPLRQTRSPAGFALR